MKRFFLLCIILWLVVFVSPLVFVFEEKEVPPLPIPTSLPQDDAGVDSDVMITLKVDDRVESLPLSEYLEGVVAAEMPALFPEEALKAQAVAARTYTMKKVAAPPAAEHGGASVCSDPSHCKAYKPISSFAASWTDSADEYTQKIKRAVSETDGEIILYNGEPITAVFHSTSSGKTENSADVWGGDVPYLVSVESPGEEDSPNFLQEKKLSPEEFKRLFLEKYPQAVFDPNPENWISKISRSEAGGIKTIAIGNVEVKGSEVRSIFGLNSTNFSVQYDDESLVLRCKGYGHGVGMSQYGARAMALEGKKYDEIIMAYYKGTKLGKISPQKG